MGGWRTGRTLPIGPAGGPRSVADADGVFAVSRCPHVSNDGGRKFQGLDDFVVLAPLHDGIGRGFPGNVRKATLCSGHEPRRHLHLRPERRPSSKVSRCSWAASWARWPASSWPTARPSRRSPLSAWGAYLMLRAAKAGRNVGELEGASCAQCMHPIASVMVGQFCAKCGKAIHNDCLGGHVQTH